MSSEPRVDRHEKDNVELVQNKFSGVQRSGRIENKSGLASSILNQLEGSIDVIGGLRVESNVGSSSINEVVDGGIYGRNHKVNVDRGGNSMISKSFAYHWANSEVGDVVVVHNIKVNNIGSCLQYVVDFFSELGESAERMEGAIK